MQAKKLDLKAKATVLLLCSAVSTPSFFFKHGNRSLVGNINTILQYATSVSACGANVGVGQGLCSTKDANLKHKK